ncbi:hypothetical protein C0583_06620 [Candidatus Parcubacteria bacterium]|mgnify:CR=1 FL=1|nr:MAG: hypothetical protein C0583_06620 [Candidatus Parcubacteria bacterium]
MTRSKEEKKSKKTTAKKNTRVSKIDLKVEKKPIKRTRRNSDIVLKKDSKKQVINKKKPATTNEKIEEVKKDDNFVISKQSLIARKNEEKNRIILLWTLVLISMLVVIVVWSFSLKSSINEISQDLDDGSLGTWEKMTDDLSGEIEGLKNDLEEIRNFSIDDSEEEIGDEEKFEYLQATSSSETIEALKEKLEAETGELKYFKHLSEDEMLDFTNKLEAIEIGDDIKIIIDNLDIPDTDQINKDRRGVFISRTLTYYTSAKYENEASEDDKYVIFELDEDNNIKSINKNNL